MFFTLHIHLSWFHDRINVFSQLGFVINLMPPYNRQPHGEVHLCLHASLVCPETSPVNTLPSLLTYFMHISVSSFCTPTFNATCDLERKVMSGRAQKLSQMITVCEQRQYFFTLLLLLLTNFLLSLVFIISICLVCFYWLHCDPFLSYTQCSNGTSSWPPLLFMSLQQSWQMAIKSSTWTAMLTTSSAYIYV